MMYNSAIVGCGRIAGKFEDLLATQKPCTHAGAYSFNESVSLIAACDPSQSALAEFCDRWEVEGVYNDPKEMFEKEDIHILSICTPVDSHYDLVMLALKHCSSLKAIWCEKPISNSLSTSYKMIKECKKKGVKLAVNYWRRWDDLHIDITDRIKSGAIGIPYVLDCQSHVGLMNCGTHLIDLSIMYSGTTPTAVNGSVIDDGSNDPGCTAYLEFENNMSAYVDCAWKENPQLGINARGDKATIFAMTKKVLLEGYRLHGDKYINETIRGSQGISPMAKAIENILATINDNEELMCSGEDAVKSLEVAVGIYMSHETGKKVSLPIKNKNYKNRKFQCRITSMTKDGKVPEEWKK